MATWLVSPTRVSLIKVTQLTRTVTISPIKSKELSLVRIIRVISPLVKVIRGRTINLPTREIKTKTLSPPIKVIRISLVQIKAASLGIMYKLVQKTLLARMIRVSLTRDRMIRPLAKTTKTRVLSHLIRKNQTRISLAISHLISPTKIKVSLPIRVAKIKTANLLTKAIKTSLARTK